MWKRSICIGECIDGGNNTGFFGIYVPIPPDFTIGNIALNMFTIAGQHSKNMIIFLMLIGSRMRSILMMIGSLSGNAKKKMPCSRSSRYFMPKKA